MANEQSEEYGLQITGVDYDDIRKAGAKPEPETEWDPDHCVSVYGRWVETHPHDMDNIFISFLPEGEFGSDRYGKGLPIPHQPPRARQIRHWFRRHLPDARLKWGVIQTER
jgi:hypothetical protein